MVILMRQTLLSNTELHRAFGREIRISLDYADGG